MRYFFLLVVYFIINSAFAQFLFLPSDFIINQRKNEGLIGEFHMLPNKYFGHNSKYPSYESHYENLLNDKMENWIQTKFPDSKIYPSTDSIVDIRKLQTLIHNEQVVYNTLKRKPLFGYIGNVPTEGEYTKETLNILREKYEIDYVVLVSVQSLYREYSKKEKFPQYKGHTAFYAWILDTETGYIEKEIEIEAAEKMEYSNKGPKFYRPRDIRVTDEFVINKVEQLQSKLKRKLKSFK